MATDRPVAARPAIGGSAPVPGDALLHPVPMLAIGLLLLNDHVLKAGYPGWWTGKLSDVAGLVFFPLFVQGVWEVQAAARGVAWHRSTAMLSWIAVATGVAFASIKTLPPAAEAYGWMAGVLRWPLDALGGLSAGQLPELSSAAVAIDSSDLVALPFLAVPLLLARRRRLQ